MELYISDHPLDCLTCSANGDCELQTQAGVVGLRDVRYGYDGANHLDAPKDESNPYFTFEASKCIVCSRCVRACEEVQGTFALTILGRGFDSQGLARRRRLHVVGMRLLRRLRAGLPDRDAQREEHHRSTARPSARSSPPAPIAASAARSRPRSRATTVVRMIPDKAGKANEGHSCVKGRFAYGYATHKDRITKPMIRARIEDPWREVSWEEAINHAACEFKRIQAKYGRDSIGAITSSRCTNEEVFVMQKLVRAGFGNNNVDTCARVCHSPTGYGLSQTYGTSAGTQDFKSVDKSDVILVIGANPTDAHPVFASRMKKRLRAGRQADRRRSAPDRPRQARRMSRRDYHLPLRPGTNVAVVNALAHVIVTNGWVDEAFVRERCDAANFESWARFIAEEKHSPEAVFADDRRRSRAACAPPRELFAKGGNARDLLRPRRHRAQPGLDHGDGARQSRDGDRQHRPRGRRREPAARPEQRAGLLRHGLVPARVLRLSPRLRRRDARHLREAVGPCR